MSKEIKIDVGFWLSGPDGSVALEVSADNSEGPFEDMELEIRELVLIERPKEGSRKYLEGAGVVLSRSIDSDGKRKWAIFTMGYSSVASKEEKLFLLAQTGSRMTDAHYAETRFDTMIEALNWWKYGGGVELRAFYDGIDAKRNAEV